MKKLEKKDGTNAEIIYHFNVDQHRIPLQQFIDTAQATKDILDDFNHQFFDNKLKYSLNVAPSKKGSLVEVLQFDLINVGTGVSLGTGGLVWAFFTSDVFKGVLNRYLKGLIGNDFGDLAERLGEKHQKLFKGKDAKNLQDMRIDKTDMLSKKEGEEIIALLMVYFLSQDIDVLTDNDMTPDKIHKAFKARNKFYKACIDNEEVQGLSFSRSPDFPITKDDFKRLIVDMPDESSQWFFETIEIAVNSPNWKRKGRKWQASSNKGKFTEFIIQDINFWQHVNVKDIDPAIEDNMWVQWIYQIKEEKLENFCVLKVLYYNGEKISEPLSEEEIQEICDHENITLKIKKDAEDLDNQFNLFSD